jgi:hypothetical protein
LRVVLSVSDDREMASTEPVHTRKWTVDQEKMFLELLVLPEFKPIGGDGDGVMERKDEARWAPLLARFLAENKHLVTRAAEDGRKRLKLDFDVGMLKRKWASFKEHYKKCKRECKVGRHEEAGEKGAAAGGPATAQAAIDKASEKWALFATFHAAFGPVQRLQDDTWTESVSPFKSLNAGTSSGPRTDTGPSQKARRPRLAALKRARLWEEDGLELVQGAGGTDGHDRSGDDDSRAPSDETPGKAVGVKHSRRSARDDRLGQALLNGRTAVAVKAAEMGDEGAMRVMQQTIASLERLAEQQRDLQLLVLERQVQAQADAQKAVSDWEQKRISSTEVLEMTKLFVGAGHPPAVARKMALESVNGQGGNNGDA